MTDVLEQVAGLCDRTLAIAPADTSARVADLRRRLEEPIRVAIAGRVNAGKSTLLNALVGELLAPTDAGECTRLVTWYREGTTYAVEAKLAGGATRQLRFVRDGGVLQIDVGAAGGDIDQLIVEWPSSRLRTMTLIDTPGLEGRDPERGARTRRFLGLDGEDEGEADAVIYLMRHLHRRDADFLETFLDRSLTHPSPANAVAVLSRADEVGGGRLDAIETASRIAGRYSSDDRVRALCATVVPVAGLLAETAVTLREDEAAALRALAALDEPVIDSLLLSVDRFCSIDARHVTSVTRRSLLRRLGLFGVRLCIAHLRSGGDSTAVELSRVLRAASGIDRLLEVIEDHFMGRAAVLRARSTISGLRTIVALLAADEVAGASDLLGELERFEMGASEFVALRLAHLARAPGVDVAPEETTEIDLLLSGAGPAERLGLDSTSEPAVVRSAVLAGVDRWRALRDHPLTSGARAEVCDLVVRCYEGLFAELEEGDTGL